MASYNKVMLLGNLTRDPEVKFTPKGTAIAEIGLAVNRITTSDSGERREEVTFVDVTIWGRQAEVAGEYMRKGRPVFIEGRLQLDTWDDKQTGQKRSKLRVVCENFQLLGGRDGTGQPSGDPAPPPRSSHNSSGGGSQPPRSLPQKPKDPDLDVEEDDIPF